VYYQYTIFYLANYQFLLQKKYTQLPGYKKQKGFGDGLSYSTPQKSEETRGNATRSHPIKKIYNLGMGWD